MNKDNARGNEPEWFRLDNAAKIYPAVIGGDFTAVFRISVTLREDIIYYALKEAVSVVAARFPYFNVTLSHGIFWFFLEKTEAEPRLHSDGPEVCTAFPIGSKKEVMYRIIVSEKTISVEFVHILTDGGGGLEFIKTLLCQYLLSAGKITSIPPGIINPSEVPHPDEFEDSFSKHFNKKIPATGNPPKATHLPFRLNRKPRFRPLTAEISAGAIKEKAKQSGLSVTEYLVTVYLMVLQDIFRELPGRKKRGIIRVQVPVNLRSHFGSRTMRNFSLFVMPEIDLRLGTHTFSEIARSVHHIIRLETIPLRISRIIRRNVGKEKSLFIRLLPVILKRFALYIAYYTFGSKLNTGVLTNLGMIDLPDDVAGYVDSFSITPPPPNKRIKINCGIATWGDKMRITFGSVAAGHELERRFFSFLAGEGLEVRMTGQIQKGNEKV